MLNLVRLQCETCHGDFYIDENMKIAKCKSCGNQYFFKEDKSNDLIDNINIANEYLHRHDFDNAITHFSGLKKNHPNDPNVAWGLLMSTYGIVWGRDDRSGDIVPTCNRIVEESILDSSAYRVAISECADEQRKIYTMRAAHIDRIQKKIKRDMELEEDFDVFISFKAKNADGSMTEDSIIARRIYDELTNRGIKTFFSEVTLKGRIGDDYEPIIYRALFSCKFFILVATSEENINAVWVKNEWTRFRDRAREEHLSGACCTVFADSKCLTTLPRIFKTQGVDLSKYPAGGYEIVLADNLSEKLGISKKASIDEEALHSIEEKLKRLEKTSQYTSTNTSNNASLYDRGMLFLEERDWKKATAYFEKALDANPYHALSYVGLMLSKKRITKIEDLGKSSSLFDDDTYYKKALRFADDGLKKQLIDLSNQVKEKKYVEAMQSKNTNTISALQKAVTQFTEIAKYKDSMRQAQECQKIIFDKREENRRRALKKQFNEVNEISGQAVGLEEIRKTLFECLSDFKKNDTKREYEGQICKMYSQKINDLISAGAFGNTLNLTCTVIQYENLDIVDRNMEYLIRLNRAIIYGIKRSADLTQVKIQLPKEIDVADPDYLSTWKWCVDAIDVVKSLPRAESEIFYGKNIVRDPISVFCSDNAGYVLSESEKSYIERHTKKHLQIPLIRDEEAREKAKAYVEAHPNAVMTVDSVRAAYFNYQHSNELAGKMVNPKLAKISFWIGFSVWLSMLVGCGLWLLIAQPNLLGSLVQAEYVNKIWSNIWRTALILVGEIIVLVILGIFFGDRNHISMLPKAIPTIFAIYLFLNFDISDISAGYALPFRIVAIGCIVLTLVFECEDIFSCFDGVQVSLKEKWNSNHKGSIFYSSYIGLIPVGILFAYTKAFLILSVSAIWIISIPIAIALIAYTYSFFENL